MSSLVDMNAVDALVVVVAAVLVVCMRAVVVFAGGGLVIMYAAGGEINDLLSECVDANMLRERGW